MRKLKQAVSLTLALALSLVLTIPVFAEPVTVESPFISSAKVTLSDMVSRETVSGVTRAYSVITVKTGSTLTVEHNKTLAENPGCTIREGYVNGRVYDVVAGGRTLNTGVDDGVPFTLTDEQIGLWFFGDGSTPNGFFVNVIAGGGANPAAPATGIAEPTNDKLTVNGVLADPTVYKIDGSNYFKIRDVAALLNGTEKQFAVGYDGALQSVTATTGQRYEKQSGDLAGAANGGNLSAAASNDAIYVNGEKINAEVYKIDGSNYFKLRDLGKALNFYVGWSADRGVYIETDKPYSE